MTPQQEAKLDRLIEQVGDVRVSMAEIGSQVKVNTAKLNDHAVEIEDYKANKNKVKGGWFMGTLVGGLIVGFFSWIFKNY